MRESALEKCLDGISPREWYELLNRKAFFWANETRVRTLLAARLYRNDEHDVITVDTASLLAHHSGRVTLSPINSGNTLYNPPLRGRYTFRTIADYPFEERRKARGLANAIAEFAVDYSVPDLVTHRSLSSAAWRSCFADSLFSRKRTANLIGLAEARSSCRKNNQRTFNDGSPLPIAEDRLTWTTSRHVSDRG